MILKMYSIHDSAVKIFLPPSFMRTHGEAERSFKNNVNNSENGHLFSNPENFTIHYVGDYNDEDGSFQTRVPELIAMGIQVKEKEQQLRMAGT